MHCDDSPVYKIIMRTTGCRPFPCPEVIHNTTPRLVHKSAFEHLIKQSTRTNREFNWKLDQVYCAWLVKWVLNREKIQLAQLCEMMNYKVVPVETLWYLVVLGHYKLVLLGTWWNRVSKRFLCLYMNHCQMLGKFEYGLPAKFWRLVGCTEMLSW